MIATRLPSVPNTLPGKNLYQFMTSPLDYLYRAAIDYGDVVNLNIDANGTYLLNHPDIIRDVLVTHHRSFIKSPVLQRSRAFLGDGLLTSEGDLHLRQRRLIQPAFHRQQLAGYAQTMTDYTLRLSRGWQDGETYDLSQEMMRLTMEIVSQTLFGANIPEQEVNEIGQAITTTLEGARRLVLPFWERIQNLPLPGSRQIIEAGAFLDQKMQALIAERRAEAARGEETTRHDLLQMLLSARDEEGDGHGMSDQLVRDEVLTLFLAGHETTANALTWTLYLLSRHAWVEDRLHEELEQVLGGRTPTAEDVEKLPYTRMVLTESMRRYPPAWVIGRQTVDDYPVRNYVLPKGSVVFLSPWVMHHDPRYYHNPRAFEPLRWIPEEQAKRPKMSYFPFGGGPRMCVGEPFAWMEGIIILAILLQRWQFRLAAGQKIGLQPRITLRPRYGMRMVLFRRPDAPED